MIREASKRNIKEGNKQAKIYVGRSLTLHIFRFMLIDCV